MKLLTKETKYIVNDLLLDSLEFNEFLSWLRKKDISFTYSESYDKDFIEFSITCRPLYYDSFCMSVLLSQFDML